MPTPSALVHDFRAHSDAIFCLPLTSPAPVIPTERSDEGSASYCRFLLCLLFRLCCHPDGATNGAAQVPGEGSLGDRTRDLLPTSFSFLFPARFLLPSP